MAGAVFELIAAASRLRDGSQSIATRMVSEGVADLVYNPLNYAWNVHEEFIRSCLLYTSDAADDP